MEQSHERPRGSDGRPWQKHDVRGVGPSGEQAPERQVKIELGPFEEREPPLQAGDGRSAAQGVPRELLSGQTETPRSPIGRFKHWLKFTLGSLQRWNY